MRPVPAPPPATDDLGGEQLILKDGSAAAVHAAGPDDRDAIRIFFRQLSPESRRSRFFTSTTPGDALIDEVSASSPDGRALTLVAARRASAVDRIIAVARGGSANAWYASFAGRTYDALSFIPPQDFKRRNLDRSGSLGEQKQIASTALDEEIIGLVRKSERHDVAVLHPSTMYKLYGPYWWGHQPVGWIRNYMRFEQLQPPPLTVDLPSEYTAVKFYFNDCFADTPRNRAFVEHTVRGLAADGPVISLSTGLVVDDHDPCEPDIAAMQGIRHLLTPDTNLLVQSAIVAGARRFVGTYGGFAYLAPLCGVPASSYYSEPGSFSLRHLDLIRDVLRTENSPGLLEVTDVGRGSGR